MKLFFDESSLPALSRFFEGIGLEVVDLSVGGLEPWYTVKAKSDASAEDLPSVPGAWNSPSKGGKMNAIKLEVSDVGSLTATTSVLEIEQEEDEFVGYTVDEESTYDKTVYINRDLYEELGSPDKITVTIVPGDTLNSKES